MFNSKFYYKCKHAAKCTRKRVDPIVKKKQAMLKFLKKDVADLLASGHYDNAFRRIDALIVEINHAFCYETIEKCCKYIVKELPIIEKQRECPPEDMEVMGTLVFAAARFSDLPELSDLRHFLMERYGGDMQFPANAEFVADLQNKTFSKEKKLQLMQSIAEEFSVKWDAQMFAHRLSNPPASSSEPTKKVFPSNTDNKPSSTMNVTVNVLENLEVDHHEERSHPHRQERKSGQPASNNMRVANMIPPYVKPKAKGVVKEDSSSNVAAHDNSKDIEDRGDKLNGYYLDKPKPFSMRRNFRNLPTTGSANVPVNEEMHRSYAYDGGRRPTDKQNDRDRNNEENLSRKDSRPPIEDVTSNVEGNRITMLQTSRVKTKEGNKHLADVHDGKYDETDIKHEKASYHNAGGRRYKVEQNTGAHDEQSSGKVSKQPLDEDEKDNVIDYGNLFSRTSNERRRHGSRPPVASYDDEYDEEEMAMDRLLMHYSRKGNERDPVKERKNRDVGANGFEHPSNGANGSGHPSNGSVPSRSRKPNLPPERAPSPARSVPKQQPDLLAPNCGRVHPKLPDYDNLAARLAALRNL